MTKSVVAPLASLLFVLGLFGCGDPSVERVCGKCSGAVRDACENAYDACKETRGCDLDDLEDVYRLACRGLGLVEEELDAGL
ncbi:MAG: hypothetical protein GXY23_09770 [Myxococcales bacterium]|jgi:hypothetical protein|nr:hypothetical protein [Myxococcales bacterium]